MKILIIYPNMNLQESIRRILREETKLPSYILRRVDNEELDDMITQIKYFINIGYDKMDAINGVVKHFVALQNEFNNDEWEELKTNQYDVYDVEKVLVNYAKSILL
jgi:hypothetical protein